jgi:hypothetical protein
MRAFLFAKTGHDKFAILLNLFVGKRAERVEEYSSGFFIGLPGFPKGGTSILSLRIEKISSSS